jgi:protein-S-isoprenylcysteine O-methyltransferase Ste14
MHGKKRGNLRRVRQSCALAFALKWVALGSTMGRVIFLYGLLCYLVSVGTLLYAIGFQGNFVVTKSIDVGIEDPLGQSLLINVGLLGLFAVRHSVMARQWFKRAWTRIVPEPAERSTYVLISSLLLLLLFWQWRPMSGIIWHASHSAGRFVLSVLFAAGWLISLTTIFSINHFDLFGLRQVYLHLRRQNFTSIPFKTPGPYQCVRHPLYLGWLFAFWFDTHDDCRPHGFCYSDHRLYSFCD